MTIVRGGDVVGTDSGCGSEGPSMLATGMNGNPESMKGASNAGKQSGSVCQYSGGSNKCTESANGDAAESMPL